MHLSDENHLKPSVCILLCTYNGENYLNEQITSIIKQEYSNWVICASDDGSTDKTKTILKKYQKSIGKDKFFIFEGPKKGFAKNFKFVASVLNKEFDYYAFCDQDDVWLPHKLHNAVNKLLTINTQENQSKPILYASITNIVDRNNKFLRRSIIRRSPSFSHSLVENISGGNTMVINKYLRKLFIDLPDNIDLVSHDWTIYQLVTGLEGIIYYDKFPTINYRQHDNNQAGTKFTIIGKLSRLVRFFNYSFKRDIDTNLNIIMLNYELLSSQNKNALIKFQSYRSGDISQRFKYFFNEDFIRTNKLENMILKFGNLFKLM